MLLHLMHSLMQSQMACGKVTILKKLASLQLVYFVMVSGNLIKPVFCQHTFDSCCRSSEVITVVAQAEGDRG